jgi:hypothetical protein
MEDAMTIRLITIFATNGPDRLMMACRRGPGIVERCAVVSPGDGSVEQAILERIGRKAIATRSHSWEPWQPL